MTIVLHVRASAIPHLIFTETSRTCGNPTPRDLSDPTDAALELAEVDCIRCRHAKNAVLLGSAHGSRTKSDAGGSKIARITGNTFCAMKE